jgi:quinol monooxygenase YgiN
MLKHNVHQKGRTMICVIASIEVADGSREAFLAAFRQLAPKVRAEQGCVEYGPMIDVPTSIPGQPPQRPNVVTIVEKWECVEALETHLMAPHMRDFRKATEAMRRSITLQVLEPA